MSLSAAPSSSAFTIRRLTGADAPAYRDLRLEALASHPDAFGSSVEEEGGEPLSWFAGRLEGGPAFGGWLADGRLAGTAGLRIPSSPKLRHKGMLWGMYVRPEARGTGMARALVDQVLAAAEGLVEEVQLVVAAGNPAAVRLYRAAGFTQYGCEPRALRVGDVYIDEFLMARPIAPAGAAIGPL
jgi:ribosomal protein S18 acetylase RimI-like enzyme